MDISCLTSSRFTHHLFGDTDLQTTRADTRSDPNGSDAAQRASRTLDRCRGQQFAVARCRRSPSTLRDPAHSSQRYKSYHFYGILFLFLGITFKSYSPVRRDDCFSTTKNIP